MEKDITEIHFQFQSKTSHRQIGYMAVLSMKVTGQLHIHVPGLTKLKITDDCASK